MIDNLYNEMIPIVEDINKLSSSIENFSISNELINTLVELKDLCFSCSSRIKTYNENFKQVSSIKMCTEEKNQKINNIDNNTSIAA